MLNNILIAQANGGDAERWLAFLREYTLVELDRNVRDTHHDSVAAGIAAPEIRAQLQTLAASPWRSVGGYLDYSGWADRERFLELDKAIACAQYPRERGV